MEAEKDSKLEKEAKIYDDAYAPDNFQSFVDGAEWGVDEVCNYLRKIKYQLFPGGPFETLLSEEQIEDLRREVLYC